jgi:hypothetical protein
MNYKEVNIKKYRSRKKILKNFPNIISDSQFLDPPKDADIKELLYCHTLGLTKFPKCPCGNHIRFMEKRSHFNTYCSKKCSDRYTALSRHKDVDIDKLPFISENASILERVYCLKNDLTERPCCKNCGTTVTFQGKVTVGYAKYCSTKCANMHDEKKQKTKERFKTKYGIDSPAKIPSVKEKIRKSRLTNTFESLKRFSNYAIPLFSIEEYHGCGYKNLYPWKCVNCNKKFLFYVYSGEIPRCPHCKDGRSQPENELIKEVKKVYNKSLVLGSRKILLSKKELDIYIPSEKLAIEYNGLYWHSDKWNNDSNYHLSKTEECEKLGIQLIHVFGDELHFKSDIVFSRIASMLKKSQTRIYARKCKCIQINSSESQKFLERNHIQGGCRSNVRYGLFYENVLVAVMTFGKPRFTKDHEWELLRFANVINTNVIGGASKLFSKFVKEHGPQSVVSYADRRWSQGKLYDVLEFNHIRTSKPAYWYTKDFLARESRVKYQKHKLSNLLDEFDQNLTEIENMKNAGYHRIWDCGNLVYSWKS